MSSSCIQRIERELKHMSRNPPSDIWTARPGGGYDLMNWEATIHNLDDPRHRGKKYRLLIEISKDYPIESGLITQKTCCGILSHNLYEANR